MFPPASSIQQVIHDLVTNLQDANKAKVEKIASMRKREELDAIKNLAELEKRAQSAESNRKAQLSAKSSTKKRQLSPRLSPTSKIQIETRINEAASRRELYLVRIPFEVWACLPSLLTFCSTKDKPGREGIKGRKISFQRRAQPGSVLHSVAYVKRRRHQSPHKGREALEIGRPTRRNCEPGLLRLHPRRRTRKSLHACLDYLRTQALNFVWILIRVLSARPSASYHSWAIYHQLGGTSSSFELLMTHKQTLQTLIATPKTKVSLGNWIHLRVVGYAVVCAFISLS